MSRLTYRPIEHADLDTFANFMADEEATRYLIVPRPHTAAESAALFDRWVAQSNGEIGMHVALLGEETVGWVGFVHRALRWGDELELGWSIRPAHQGRGYATEAALHFRPLGPERVVHLIHPQNAPSINVAKRLGAALEQETTIRGKPVSVYVSPRTAPAQPAVHLADRVGIYE